MSKISIVIPTMNEPAVQDIIKRAFSTFGKKDTEIIVVDNSSDDTAKRAEKAGARVILQRESGYGDAYNLGFRQVKGNIICMLDGDGTYHPEELKKMVEIVKKRNADIVIGNRFAGMEKGSMSFFNKLGNKFLTKLTNKLYNMKISDSQSGMRVMSKQALEKLNLKHREMPFASEMIIEARKKGLSIVETPIKYSARIGRPKLKRFSHGIQILFYSLRLIRDWNPLLLFGALGTLLALAGVGVGMFIVYQWSIYGEISRLASVVLSSLLIITGVFFVGMGLMLDLMVNMLKDR